MGNIPREHLSCRRKIAHTVTSIRLCLQKLPPNHNERTREGLRPLFNPFIDVIRREPITALDLLWMQRERSFCVAAIHPDMFHPGLGCGGKFEKPSQWRS